MNPTLIIAAVVVLVILIGVLYYINKSNVITPPDTQQPPPTDTQPPATSQPPTTSQPPVISQPPPVVSQPPPLPTQSPLTPDRWAPYYNTLNPAQWLVLRKYGDTTQCFADPKATSQCLALPNKIDAGYIANVAIIQDVNKIKLNLPAGIQLYPVINCNDQMKQDPAHWCNMFG